MPTLVIFLLFHEIRLNTETSLFFFFSFLPRLYYNDITELLSLVKLYFFHRVYIECLVNDERYIQQKKPFEEEEASYKPCMYSTFTKDIQRDSHTHTHLKHMLTTEYEK